MLDKCIKSKLSYIQEYSIGELLNRINNTGGEIISFYLEFISNIVTVVINIIISIYFMVKFLKKDLSGKIVETVSGLWIIFSSMCMGLLQYFVFSLIK